MKIELDFNERLTILNSLRLRRDKLEHQIDMDADRDTSSFPSRHGMLDYVEGIKKLELKFDKI
jgi:hypothetical protein